MGQREDRHSSPHPHCSELQSSASPALLTQQPLTFILPSHTLQCLLCLDCSFQPFPWLGPGFLTPTAYFRGPCLSQVAFPPQLVRISEIRFGYVSAGSLRTHSPSLLPEGRTLSVSPEQDYMCPPNRTRCTARAQQTFGEAPREQRASLAFEPQVLV